MAAARPFAGARTAALAASGGRAPPPPPGLLPPPARARAAAPALLLSSPRGDAAAFASSSRSGGGGGGGKGDAGAKRRRKEQDGAPRSSSTSSSSPPPVVAAPQAPPAPPAAPPPEVGWMWSGSGSGGRAAATKQSLKSAGLRAKKSLGQNFLTDEATLARIVRASGVQPGDRVLEVGPGTGNLTRHLISAGARVTAVEKDDALAARLADAAPGLEALVHGDVLRVGLGAVVARMLLGEQEESGAGGGGGPAKPSPPSPPAATEEEGAAAEKKSSSSSSVKIVANLPYNITKEFLLAALPLGGELGSPASGDRGGGGAAERTGEQEEAPQPQQRQKTENGGVSEVTLMLEEDAARRLADPRPGRPDYRAMSVLVHRWSRPQYLFRIPRDRYFPQPGVDGAMVRFRLVAPRDRPALPFRGPGDAAERAHAALVNAAFSERRKMMRNVLTSGLGRGGRAWGAPTRDPAVVAAALLEAGARDEARPQELSPAQFAAFHCALARRAAEAKAGGGGARAGDDDGEDDEDEDDDDNSPGRRRNK